MDLQKLYNSIHRFEQFPFTLNSEKIVLVTNSLLLLQNENHFKKIFFWGIIQSLEIDYYIAFGYKTDAITDRTFFYSDNCQHWKLLPTPNRVHLTLTELCRRPVQGDPGLVIEVVDDAPGEDLFPDENVTELQENKLDDNGGKSQSEISEKQDSEMLEKERAQAFEEQELRIPEEQEQEPSKVVQDQTEQPITSGELKEEDRLAAIIQIITEETAIIPRGGLFKQTDGIHTHSRAFEGLELDDADKLCSFQHYRLPQEEWNTNLLTRVDYNYALDFLDTIDKDIPNDCWTAQLAEGDRVILLRNLTWPGFMFFHHLQTPDYGFIYVGTGQRNCDIPFMTQINGMIDEMTEKPKLSAELLKLSKSSTVKSAIQQSSSTAENEVKQKPLLSEDVEELSAKKADVEGEIITTA